jgi:hypothetical protein
MLRAAMRLTQIVLVSAMLFASGACSARSSGKIRINVLRSNAVIRKQLMQVTPLGTPAQQVYQFLLTGLEYDKGTHIAGAPGQPYRSTMTVQLGHYFPLFPTVVQATWRFDEQDRLINIEVERFNTAI